MDHDAVAHQTQLGVAGDLALQHIAAGHDAHAGDLVDLAHLDAAQLDLLELGIEHALHGGLDLLDALIDDAVHAHIHLVALGDQLGLGVGTDIEAHDDGVGGGGQHDVALVDGAHCAVDDPDVDLLVAQLLQRDLDGLGGALNIGLDDDVQVLHLALLDLAEQVVQTDLLHRAVHGVLLLLLALLGQLAGHALVGDHIEVVTGLGHLGHTDDLHGHGGTGVLQLSAAEVGHGTDAAHGGAGDQDIALMQGAVLNQQGGHRAAALLQPGLDDRALGGAVGVGLQLAHLGGQHHHLQQVVDAVAGLGGDLADNGVAAPLLGHQTVLGQLLHDAVGVGTGLIHLVDGDNDRNFGGLGVVDGLNGLGHDAVIGGHDQNGQIGDHRAAGAHGGEGLMAGGVQEGDDLLAHSDLIGADGLGNTAGLAGGHIGVADIVQQAGLAVVDVAHDHNDGGALHQILFLILVVVDQSLLDGDDDLMLHDAAQLLGDDGGGVKVDHVGQGSHDAILHQGLDHLGAGLFHPAGQLAHGDLVGDLHLHRGLAGDLLLEAAHLAGLLLLTALGGLALLLLAVAALLLDLLLALALLHPLGALGGQILQMLVIAVQIDVSRLAGVNDLLLGHAALGRALRGGLGGLLGLLLLAALAGVLRLGCALGLGLLLTGLSALGVHLGQALHLVVLGQVLKHHAQLPVGQHLHGALGGLAVLGEDLGDLLAAQAKVLGQLTHTILHINTHIK